MLSQEFIPTSSSDGDFAPTTNTITNFNTNMNSSSFSTTVAATASKSVNYSTNPEGIKFVPQPPVQFYYSLQVRDRDSAVYKTYSNPLNQPTIP